MRRRRDAMTGRDAGYVVVDTWRVKAGKEAEIIPILAETRRRFLDVPGIRSVDYAHVDGDPGRILVVFRYADKATREAFVATDDLKATMTRLSDYWESDGLICRGVAI
jgi:quinol monooxygenase YgiN